MEVHEKPQPPEHSAFQQIHESSVHQFLGMAIVERLVEARSGRITPPAQDAPGSGWPAPATVIPRY